MTIDRDGFESKMAWERMHGLSARERELSSTSSESREDLMVAWIATAIWLLTDANRMFNQTRALRGSAKLAEEMARSWADRASEAAYNAWQLRCAPLQFREER